MARSVCRLAFLGLMLGLCVLCVSSALAIDYTMTADRGTKTTWDWGTATDWSPNGVPDSLTSGSPPDTARVDFTVNSGSSGGINVDLGGTAYTIDKLTVTEGAGNADGNLLNGTLNVPVIEYAGGARELDFETSLTINAGSSLLEIGIGNNDSTLDFLGTVTGTGGLVLRNVSSQGNMNRTVRMRDYQIGGTIEFASGVADGTVLDIRGVGGNTTHVTSVTFNDPDPRLMARRNSGTGDFVLEVDGAITAASNVYRTRFDADANSTINLTGAITYNRDSNDNQLRLDGTNGTLNVNGGLVNPTGRSFNVWAGNGTINVDDGNPWSVSGETRIDGATRGIVNVENGAELGTGAIVVRSGGKLNVNYDLNGTAPGAGLSYNTTYDPGGGMVNFTTTQTWGGGFSLTQAAYHAIGGDLTGASFGVGGTDIDLADDAVLVDSGPDAIVGQSLTRTGLNHGAGPARFWKAVADANNATFTVGDDGTTSESNIYKGVAFTAARTPADWRGTLNSLPGQDLNFVVASDVRFRNGSGTSGSGDTPDFNSDTGVVNVYGSGLLEFETNNQNLAVQTAGWDTLNRYGVGDDAGNNLILRFDKSNNGHPAYALETGKTVSVWGGRFDVTDATAVEAGATININDEATYWTSQTVSTAANYNFNAGSAIFLTGGMTRLDNAAPNWNIVGNDVILVFNTEGNPTSRLLNEIIPNVNVVLDDGNRDNFGANGLTIGDGHFLMTSRSTSSDISGGSGTDNLLHAVGGTTVGLAAFSGRTLDVNRPVDFAGADLVVGSATAMTTTWSNDNVRRYTAIPTGTVRLDAGATVGNVTVHSGTLRINDGTGDTFTASGDFIVNDARVALINTAPVASNIIAGDLVINDGGRFTPENQTNVTQALLDGLIASNVIVNDGGRFHMQINANATGLVGPYVVNQKITITGDAANSTDNAQLWHDIQGTITGPREVHYADVTLEAGAVLGIREADGAARAALTLTGDATVGEDGSGNDFDLSSVASSGGPHTLTLGQAATFNATLRGTSDAITTLDLANAVLTVDAGDAGAIDGSAVVQAGSTLTINGGLGTVGGNLQVDGNVGFSGGGSLAVDGILSGTGTIAGGATTSDGVVAPGTSVGILTTGDITLGTTLEIEIDGPGGPGIGHDQLDVNGLVDLNGADLEILLGYVPGIYSGFVLIDNDGTDPVSGLLTDPATSLLLNELDAVLVDNPGGYTSQFRISYVGGDGNDVVLLSVPEPSTWVALVGLALAGLLQQYRRRRRR